MDKVITNLVEVQYNRNDIDFHRGTFRVRGEVLDIIPAYQHEKALRLEFFGEELERISEIDPLTGEVLGEIGKTVIYPASHYVSDRDNLTRAMVDIREELYERLTYFKENNKLVEEQRLEQRTQLDLEMMQELGYCNGIENYSRHMDGRKEGDAPATLLDYFAKDFLLFVDESHLSVPQVGAMSKGDRSRKMTLTNYGFRLPSALDNRPLNFEEFLERIGQAVFVSATPAKWELDRAQGLVIEQIIRPTGLLDPIVEIRPSKGQMDDLVNECKIRAANNERVLITTLTKRMAEELTDYLNNKGVNTKYLHSDIETLERIAIIKALRVKEFDVLVGINLLREGLDIPEVSLVSILDADKEGFLRSSWSLIQTFGRAARNSKGRVILYADKITKSMQFAMDETSRRRTLQEQHNLEHNITPTTIIKGVNNSLDSLYTPKKSSNSKKLDYAQNLEIPTSQKEIEALVKNYEKLMREAAKELEFEKAAMYRDRIVELKNKLLIN